MFLLRDQRRLKNVFLLAPEFFGELGTTPALVPIELHFGDEPALLARLALVEHRIGCDLFTDDGQAPAPDPELDLTSFPTAQTERQRQPASVVSGE